MQDFAILGFNTLLKNIQGPWISSIFRESIP
jgi:hypothetical protein